VPPPAGYPPPPGAGYPPAGSGADDSRPYSIGDAFNWEWKKFQENVGTIIVAALIYLVIVFAVQIVGWLIVGGMLSQTTEIDSVTGEVETSGGGFVATLVVTAILAFVGWVLISLMQAGIIRGATEITHGRKPVLQTMFSTDGIGNVLLAAVLVAVITAIGSLLCYIPGLIAAFYLMFTMFFVVERGLPAVEAIKASAQLVNQHVATLIGFFLASIVAFIIGAILCGVGLLVAIPVVILAQAYTYRKLQGEAVAA